MPSSPIPVDNVSPTPVLRRSLGFPGVLGQSIAGIAPTTTPTINIALAFVAVGSGSWLAYLIGTVAILLIALNLVPFARTSSGAGSLSDFVARGLGEPWRVVTGWALLLAYLATCVAVLSAGAGYLTTLFALAHLAVPPVVLVGVAGVICGALAYRDVRVSTGLMLTLEIISVVLVLLLCLAILVRLGPTADLSQLRLDGMTPGGLSNALLIAVLSFAGFEASAALGDEAKDPLRNIPKVLLATPFVTGIFFIFTAYMLVLGFNRYDVNVAASNAPLDDLAARLGRPDLGVLIALGASISLIGCTLACMVAASRVAFSLAGRGALPSIFKKVLPSSSTPGPAVRLAVGIVLPLAVAFASFAKPLDIYDWFGTFATFGFIAAYGLTCVAAPLFLHRAGKLRMGQTLAAVGALAVLAFVLAVSVYPPQPAPAGVIPWLFVGLAGMGTAFSYFWSRRPRSTKQSVSG